jgi:hypothetical protein
MTFFSFSSGNPEEEEWSAQFFNSLPARRSGSFAFKRP